MITSSPVAGGNGDALIEAAKAEVEKAGAKVQIVHVRQKKIGFCHGCYACEKNGVCIQKDDFMDILRQIHEADAIIAAAPIYYNCMAAQMITLVNRLCCTFACKTYQIGLKKKVGAFLTCTGSDVEEMKHHVWNILTLPSVNRAITAFQTEVFTRCGSHDTCRQTPEYLERARKIAQWAVED